VDGGRGGRDVTALALAQSIVWLLVAVALVVALLRDALAATVVFAAYSLAMAMLWVTLQAPDVALTEAAVGAGVTTSLFLVALAETGRPVGATTSTRRVNPTSAVAALAVAAVVVATVPALPAVGDGSSPPFRRVVPYYLDQSVPQFGVENVVTAILAGYRGFDTFGEVTVVFAAGVAVLVVFRKEVL
jgi:multicomponent Na+:H+ antiporter subunit B